jgi:hypothetical protein
MQFLDSLDFLIFFLSPLVLIVGIIVIISNKEKRQTGVKMI